VEFHLTQNLLENTIWYRVGRIDPTGGSVTWGDSKGPLANGYWPAVTISKEGYVIVSYSMVARTGMLNPSNPGNIEWTYQSQFRSSRNYPALTTNGTYALAATWSGISEELFYWVAKVCR
jgi:hypothetical protein